MNRQVYTTDKHFRRLIVYTAGSNGRIICTTTVRPNAKLTKAERREELVKALKMSAPKLKFVDP